MTDPLSATPPRHINEILDEAIAQIKTETTTIGGFMDALHERGFGIFLFLFALPMALPLPVPPGINILFSTPLLFLTFQQIYGAHSPWLPQFIRRRTLTRAWLGKTITQSKPWLARLSFFIKPRLAPVTHGRIAHLTGLFGFIFALSICVPLPFTNTVPSFAIALMAVGVLMRDGLAVIAGMVIGSAWITLLLTLGVAGLRALIHLFI